MNTGLSGKAWSSSALVGSGAVLGKALGRFHDRRGVRMARLGDLPTLLGGEGPSRSESVLRAA